MIYGSKLVLGILTALTGFTLAYGPYNAPSEAPTTTISELYTVIPEWPITVPAPTTTTTTTTTVPVTTCVQVATLAVAAGLPPDELDTAVQIAASESRCTSEAFNATDPNNGSYSIWQINGFWCEPSTYWPQGWLQAHGILTTCNDLYDPMTNARAMVAIWHNSGWHPWTTYNGN